MNYTMFILILFNVLLNTTAQVTLKMGMDKIGAFDFNWQNLLPISSKVISSPWIISGMLIYVGSVTIWLIVLSRIPVSVAYPIASLGYVTSTIAAYYLCGETITLSKTLGIIIILIGVYLVAKN